MIEEGSFHLTPDDLNLGSQEGVTRVITREETLRRMDTLFPEVIGMTKVDGVPLRELLAQAKKIEEGTGLRGDAFSMSATELSPGTNYRRVDLRYLQNLGGRTPNGVQDELQLWIHSSESPWGGNTSSRTLFVDWTETGEPVFGELYVHFAGTGLAYGVNSEGVLTPRPYSQNQS